MKKLAPVILLCLVSATLLAQSAKTNMKWYNEPKQWKLDSGKIKVVTDPQTDFWRITFYRYITDNGHFYYEEQNGNFEATVKVTGNYKDLYDQAGLMIRADSANWIKSGIEFVNGAAKISSVFTRIFSDWSVISRQDLPKTIWLKLVRRNDSVELSYSINGKDYEMQRLGYFPPTIPAKIGIMAATPDGTGFNVAFEDFVVKKLKH
jgi:regulation of enolase protein 1 (concanavalin A-like superfamily)